MQIKRMLDVRQSNVPQAIGFCAQDSNKLIAIVNEAQERLVYAGGESGWWGSWQKMVFNVDSATDPFITLPRTVARLTDIDYCRTPIRIQNEFYEFLEAGIGLQAQRNSVGNNCSTHCTVPESYDRGLFPTFVDFTPGKIIRVYITDGLDISRRILIQGTDTNDMKIYSLDGLVQVSGIWLDLTSPFVDMPLTMNTLTGIQKDVTIGAVQIYEVDAVTGDQTLISTMEPGERVAGYRRYFLHGLPRNCCDSSVGATTVQVTAMAKLAFIPVVADSDYLIIQNIPALKEECQATRFAEMDDSTSASQSVLCHQRAMRLLNGELIHHLGKQRPAINFAPFGNAHLRRQMIGSLI